MDNVIFFGKTSSEVGGIMLLQTNHFTKFTKYEKYTACKNTCFAVHCYSAVLVCVLIML